MFDLKYFRNIMRGVSQGGLLSHHILESHLHLFILYYNIIQYSGSILRAHIT